jgi:tRNA A58 N-methylase Trm61
MDNREQALNFLENSVKSAFDKGFKVNIGKFDYVFLDKGQEVEVGDHVMQTTESGIFQKTPVTQYNPETQQMETVRHTLLHYGHTDQLRGILNHLCRDMSVHEIDLTMVGIAGHSVLKGMIRKRGSGEGEPLSL